MEYFASSGARTVCSWKGLASYYDVTTEHGTAKDVAWYYPHPSPVARRIKNHVAFYPEVTIEGRHEPRPAGEGGLRAVLACFLNPTKAS